ncbi:MAG: NERD domain-containing protein/DEAD/DEAH box helicase [Burkholderiaceae bacterium]
MATLIPSIGTCVSRMTQGERRLAERLEQKLDDDYLVWYDVPVGPTQTHPDFVVLHPRRGLLILEAKDWRLDTIQKANKQVWEIAPGGQPKNVANPIEQARHYAHQVVDALSRDKQLIAAAGKAKGSLAFPWSYGVVFTHITRRQFESAGLSQAIDAHRVMCADEMTEPTEPESFQSRLWDMFPTLMRGVLSLPQIDRVRWILFPEVRVSPQLGLFDPPDAKGDADAVPDIVRVMDLQQEQLARSLGEGHRIIHGVAGSGKTMILGYRAEQLAKAVTTGKAIFVLCYNEPLAVKLAAVMKAKGLADRVLVRHFHKWCRQQLVAFGQPIPPQGPQLFEHMVDNVIRGVERRQIPSGQYLAVLIDEGHDFQPEWLKLVTQMVDPNTNCLLLLYDDAQSIYERARTRQFSFKSVGIQAQGRTTVLRINYRNTRQVLNTANLIAADLLRPEDGGSDDGIPMLQPISCGREGHEPVIIRLPSLRDEATQVAELLSAAHEQGFAWGDMAIICRRHAVMDACAAALRRRRLPHHVRRGSGSFNPTTDTIKVLTMHASKGLEFSVVALPGVGHMPEAGENEADEARLFYVAATRATQTLYITLSGDGAFASRLGI